MTSTLIKIMFYAGLGGWIVFMVAVCVVGFIVTRNCLLAKKNEDGVVVFHVEKEGDRANDL